MDDNIDLKTPTEPIKTEVISTNGNDVPKENFRDNTTKSTPITNKIPENSNQTVNCYCNKERNYNIIELLCANCNRWYHESCIGYQLGKLVPFMVNYIFVCKNCSPTGLESFKKNPAMFPQMCVTAIGNLMQETIKNGNPQIYFSRDKDIIPFIESHWESMTTTARRVTQSWHSTITRSLVKETDVLFGVVNGENGSQSYKLLFDISQIKPNYEAMIKGGHLKVTETGIQPTITTGLKGRGAKRKTLGDGTSGIGSGKKGRSAGDQSNVKLPAHGYPLEHPFNKDGYKYILAEPDPHAPFRQEFDESNESAGKLIPGWLYRPLCPNQVLLALHDRAPQLHISEDRLSVTGEKGYCMVRATHSVSSGNWYWETTVEEMPENSACRIGWSQEFANIQAPLGYDKFGYSWRSRKGTVFHESRGKHYSSGFGEGDTLGIMICLPSNVVSLPPTHKDLILIKFKSHLYYEEQSQDSSRDALKCLKPLIGSKIIYYKNGECFNESAVDLYDGKYFPTVSLYKNCTLSLNFGPNFKYPPPQTDDFKYKGVWERAGEAICEQTLADISFLTINEGKLKLSDI
ncbi:set1/Ash2 histone methyltransferase complex subunit ASH2 [Aphis gossypii]|uniref:B30.2/SPRY domain-containing protein n=1 Tax=Aphis gossypii TaxID=80765 RepID=A0A9P0NJE5_APHGO|nr:set1/Ash2 histone methyltransferase complex subunit ASH2 [Aphis gossypii]XP_027847890.1 set1/Ash2 histone methyltransferase complex subunit ASH2 [Aphis gossypii]CAH1725860.1 unnamed protein product [Aphis gossypii]